MPHPPTCTHTHWHTPVALPSLLQHTMSSTHTPWLPQHSPNTEKVRRPTHVPSLLPLTLLARFGFWCRQDRICCFNRHYAEHSGYFEGTTFIAEQTAETGTTTFYDSVTGTLPMARYIRCGHTACVRRECVKHIGSACTHCPWFGVRAACVSHACLVRSTHGSHGVACVLCSVHVVQANPCLKPPSAGPGTSSLKKAERMGGLASATPRLNGTVSASSKTGKPSVWTGPTLVCIRELQVHSASCIPAWCAVAAVAK